jgi:hypothetical protein
MFLRAAEFSFAASASEARMLMVTYEMSAAHGADTKRAPPVELVYPSLLVADGVYLTISNFDGTCRLSRVRDFLAHELAGIGLACPLILIFLFVKPPVSFVAVLVVAALIVRRALASRGVAI